MSKSKRNYWLKLKEDFFQDDVISWIEEQDKGVYYINFYLKLCLKTINSEGILVRKVGDMLIPYDPKTLSKITGTDTDTIIVAMELFKKTGLVEVLENGEIYLNQVKNMIGSETGWAEKKRLQRAGTNTPRLQEPKSNAERQRMHRAKKYCEDKQHVPFIENYINNKRYGGNYYIVFRRDQCKCKMCGSIENLCVHHIDGYDENKPQNNAENKMVTLCRACHGIAHSNEGLSQDILESISYFDEIVTKGDSNGTVTDKNNVTCPTDIDIDIDKDKDNIYSQIRDKFNSTCKEMNSITRMTDKRKSHINQRLQEFSLEEIFKVIEIASKSEFLNGHNNKNWKANFDWIINPNNFVKILEGNYNNKTSNSKKDNEPRFDANGFEIID